MTPWGFASVASLLATGSLAAAMLVRGPRTPARLPFVLLMGSFALWDLGEAVARLAPAGDLDSLLPWIRIEWIGISLTSGTFLHFVLNFVTGRPLRRPPWRIPVVYAVSIAVAPLVVATDGIVMGVADSLLGPSAVTGPAYLPAAIWYEAWFVFTLAALLRTYVRSGSPDFRSRSRPVILVLAAAVLLGSGTEVFWPFYTEYPANLGLGSVYTLAVAIVAAYSTLRFRFLEIAAVTERTPAASRFRLRPGLAYLFLSRDRDPAFLAFREIVGTIPGLCITGVHPPRLQERFALERTPILWVTTASGAELSVRPKGLEFELFQSVARFVKENPATVVLVDDIDLLICTNGFDAVARFLQRLNNLSTGRGSTTIAALDPEALPEGQLTLLRGMFDEVREAPPPVSFLEPVRPGEAGSLLIEGDPEAAFSLYESLAPGDGGVVVTTKNPARLRRRLGERAHIVWIAGSGEAAGKDEGPVAIDLEAGRLATGLLRDRPRPVLFLTDLEQLRLFAPFPRVLEFVKMLIDHVAMRDGVLVASVAPKGIAPTELASLRRRFDRVREL